jgi:ferrous-iron efflux pump FieF
MENPEKAALLMRRAAIASVCVAVTLTLLKAGAWFYSNSVAMLASMADSALDLLASAANYVAIRQSLTPADHEHRFGHGKAEPLAGLGQTAFITFSALFLIQQSVMRLLSPAPIENSNAALAVMTVSILLTAFLVWYQNRAIIASRSTAVRADRAHYVGDLAGNLAVILGIALASLFGWLWADPVFALGVAGLLLYSAFTVGRDSLDQLMDRELPDDDRARIIRIVEAHPHVKGLRDLKTRMAGLSTFIQVNIYLDGAMALEETHTVTDGLEHALENAFPGAEVIIHQEPAPQPA